MLRKITLRIAGRSVEGAHFGVEIGGTKEEEIENESEEVGDVVVVLGHQMRWIKIVSIEVREVG
jgi:hypothetical protein